MGDTRKRIFVDPKSTIAGLPALQLRRFLHQVSDPYGFNIQFAAYCLHMTEARTKRIVGELVRLGYVECADVHGRAGFRVTLEGRRVACASSARPLLRSTADRAVRQLLERVGHVNEQERFLLRVTRLGIFGSYLTSAERLNDVDVALALQRKHDGEDFMRLGKARVAAATQGGRRFYTFSGEAQLA